MFAKKIISGVALSLLLAGSVPAAAEDHGAETSGADATVSVLPAMPEQISGEGTPAFDPGAGFTVTTPARPNTAVIDGRSVSVRSVEKHHAGYFLPDGQGGFIWSGAHQTADVPDSSHAAAGELKLKVREMADQLLADTSDPTISAGVALPATFVNQDNFMRTSSFGRFLAEQFIYEFNQRGLRVREYRTDTDILMRHEEGDFYLTRNKGSVVAHDTGTTILVGTYYADRDNVFINARLLRTLDGMVLRTASITFPQTEVSRTMLARASRRLDSIHVGMRDFRELTSQTTLTEIDLGEDLH